MTQTEHRASSPGSRAHEHQGTARGLLYVETVDPADSGESQQGPSLPRSVACCGKTCSVPADGSAVGSLPTSLDALETSPHELPEQTRPQLAIHARFAAPRASIWSAFCDTEDEQLRRRATKLELCCSMPTIRVDSEGAMILCPQRCRDRCCPLCSCRRAATTGARAIEACKQMNAARLITLTVPHVDAPLVDQIKAVRAAFTRMRRLKSWRAHVSGGVYGFEVKLSERDGRWHPHIHAIADGEYYPHEQLRDDWREALNHPDSLWQLGPDDPLSTDVQLIRDRRRAADYVAKYIAKPASLASWPPESIREFASAMHGVRLLSTFGKLHGVCLDPKDPNEDPGATEHVAGITTLNIAARRGQRSAQVALLLVRLVFPKAARWTHPGLVELPPEELREGESMQQTLRRVAAAAELEFWTSFEANKGIDEIDARERRRRRRDTTGSLDFDSIPV